MNQNLRQALENLRLESKDWRHRVDIDHLAERIKELGVSVPQKDLQWFATELLQCVGGAGEFYVPSIVTDVVRLLLDGRSADMVCDPWAGLGVLVATVADAVQAKRAIACERNTQVAALGQALAPGTEWHTEDPLSLLQSATFVADVVACVPPFGAHLREPLEVPCDSGERLRLSGDLASALIVSSSLRLSSQGVGLFVVTPNFFRGRTSVVEQLPQLGLGVESALALPAGAFSPATNVPTYLIVVRKRQQGEMFVAQLGHDAHTNRQVLANLRAGQVDGPLELGRRVAPVGFRGLESLRVAEQLQRAQRRFGGQAVCLRELSAKTCLGRPGAKFAFPAASNAVYIPLIGISDVVDSPDRMTLKLQNYAQVVIDGAQAHARFVASFLNSDLGRAVREGTKSGVTIPKLNAPDVMGLKILVPDFTNQGKILETAVKLAVEKNTVLGLQNELDSLNRELWNAPDQCDEIASRVKALSDRLAHGVASHAAETLDQWFETLPFPFASILRAWRTASSDDFKTRYEHLLHFFEATAEFLSVVFLSAFASQRNGFSDQWAQLGNALRKQNLSVRRATFGTWKTIVDYFAKQTRTLLSGDADSRQLCGSLFADPTLAFPAMMARKELGTVLAATNKMRNDWSGHGGVVSEDEARSRNEQLVTQLQGLRQVMGDGWRRTHLLRCLGCKPRNNAFDNEVALLVGSNSEFLKESRRMSTWLDVDRLYLSSLDTGQALLLLPLIQMGSSPTSAKNACYFFNRVEKDGLRFVSYHFAGQPELNVPSTGPESDIPFLSEVGIGR